MSDESMNEDEIMSYIKEELAQRRVHPQSVIAELSSEVARLRMQTYRLLDALRPLADVSIERKAYYSSDMLVFLPEADIDRARSLVDDIAGEDIINQHAIADELADIARVILRVDGDRDSDNGSNLKVEHTCSIATRLKSVALAIGYVENAA